MRVLVSCRPVYPPIRSFVGTCPANLGMKKYTAYMLTHPNKALPCRPIPAPRDNGVHDERNCNACLSPRWTQSEMVSHTVLRCRVPPGPGTDGTGRVAIRVEVPSRSSIGLRRSSSTSSVAFDSGSRDRQQGAPGVDIFEYRCPATSPSSNSAPAISRSGTPRVRQILSSCSSVCVCACVSLRIHVCRIGLFCQGGEVAYDFLLGSVFCWGLRLVEQQSALCCCFCCCCRNTTGGGQPRSAPSSS